MVVHNVGRGRDCIDARRYSQPTVLQKWGSHPMCITDPVGPGSSSCAYQAAWIHIDSSLLLQSWSPLKLHGLSVCSSLQQKQLPEMACLSFQIKQNIKNKA